MVSISLSEAAFIAFGVAVIGALGGMIASWINGRRSPAQNRVDEASATERLVAATKILIEPLRQEVTALRFQTDAQLQVIEQQNDKIDALEASDTAKGDEIAKLQRTQKANILHIEKLDRKVVYLTNGVGILTSQITKAGLTPEWTYSQDDELHGENGDAAPR